MVHVPKTILILMLSYFLQLVICAQEFMGENICRNTDDTLRCCSDYYFLSGSCRECFGAYGENCSTPCGENNYGYRCRGTCNCTENQVCDKYTGCVDRGVFGKDCRMECLRGYFGKSCKERCTSNETESCDPFVRCMEDGKRRTMDIVAGNKEECTSIEQLIAGMIILNISCFTLCFTLYLCRRKRQRMYDVQNVMDMSTNRQGSQKIQMIHFSSLTEKCGEDVQKYTLIKEYEKQMTNKYNRIIFPKFTSVDIPGDQYSTAIIRDQHVPVDEGSTNSTDTSNRGECLRHSISDPRSARNSRPYSLVRNDWNN